MKIKAAVIRQMELPPPYARSRPVSIETVELDPPGPGEVLVQVKAAGLCHSDLSIITGDRPRVMPMAMGHEGAGVVAEVGEGVSDLARGDHVVFVFMPSCGLCAPCMEGRPALCEPGVVANTGGTLLSGARRLRDADGKPLNHQVGVSAFAEYAVCSRRSLIKIDPDLPLDLAALFGCAVVTGMGAVVNAARVQPGASVAVVGLGGVGLSALLGALAAGAGRVIAVDALAHKLDLARQLGASDAFNASEADCVDKLRAATKGGVDYAIEAASSTKALELAYRITRRGGTTVTVSLPHPTHTVQIPAAHLVVEERTLKGSYIGSAVPTRDVPRYLALYRTGRLPIDRLLSERLRLEEINEGFDRLAAGDTVRQVITF
jgi:alcohol dehydrogenase